MLRARPGKFSTKAFSWNPTLQQWLKRTYSAGMWFRPTEENFTSLDDLAASIVSISADPSAMVIRGALKPTHRDALTSNPNLEVRKNKLQKAGSEPFFDETERCWVMIDIDNFPLRPSDDLVDDPGSAVAHAIEELLPPPFHDVRCFFQLSSFLAGFVHGILKCHVFFWLSSPIADTPLKSVMQQCAPRLSDYSVFQAVQPHFIAAPIIEGGPDPIPRRFGWIDGIDGAVTLPPFVKTKPNGHANATAHGSSHIVGSEVEDHLIRFGDGPGLDGSTCPCCAQPWPTPGDATAMAGATMPP